MANEWSPDDVFDVWADERARQIVVALEQEPRRVADLLEACTGSRSSIYRRVEILEEAGLLEERVELDDDGHHYHVYELAFDELRVRVDDGNVLAEIVAEEEAWTEQFDPLTEEG